MVKALIINGANLNLLGERADHLYPEKSLEEINQELSLWGKENELELQFFQSNSEGEIIDGIHKSRGQVDFIVINPGAFTHYSYALRDAIEGAGIPTIEVHLTQIYAREEFRQKSVISPVCLGTITGFAEKSYLLALVAGKLLCEPE